MARQAKFSPVYERIEKSVKCSYKSSRKHLKDDTQLAPDFGCSGPIIVKCKCFLQKILPSLKTDYHKKRKTVLISSPYIYISVHGFRNTIQNLATPLPLTGREQYSPHKTILFLVFSFTSVFRLMLLLFFIFFRFGFFQLMPVHILWIVSNIIAIIVIFI